MDWGGTGAFYVAFMTSGLDCMKTQDQDSVQWILTLRNFPVIKTVNYSLISEILMDWIFAKIAIQLYCNGITIEHKFNRQCNTTRDAQNISKSAYCNVKWHTVSIWKHISLHCICSHFHLMSFNVDIKTK